MKKLFKTALVSLCLAGLAACSHGGASVAPILPANDPHHNNTLVPKGVFGGIGPSALLQVLLGDAPPNLNGKQMSALNIGVKEVDGIQNGQTVVLATFQTPYVVNVLNDPGNSGQVVANSQVNRSAYQELRLVVDLPSSSGVFADGSTMPIKFQKNGSTMSTVGAGSNTSTSGDGDNAVDITVNQPFTIPNDGTNAVRVDFNAFEALNISPQGDLVAQPALFVAPIDDCGSISGHVVDQNGNPVQNAVAVAFASDGSIGNTVSTDADGNFSIHTLNAGTYGLEIYNTYVNAAGMVEMSSSKSSQQFINAPSAGVVGGQDTNVGTIQD